MAPRSRNDQQGSNSNGGIWGGVQDIVSSITSLGDGGEDQYVPGERIIVENGQWRVYDGPGLVTSNGQILRREDGQTFYYDLERDSEMLLSGLSPRGRGLLLGQLVDAGFLNESQIGDFGSELNAVQELHYFANIMGLERNAALNARLSGGPVRKRSGSAAPRIRVTSAEDLGFVADRVAQDTIGRGLTEDEKKRFVSSYQGSQVSYQRALMGGGAPTQEVTSPEVAAQTFAQQVAPTEANGYQFLNYMNLLMNSLGGPL